MITSKTKPSFILGNPVKHSLSPVFQNSAFLSESIDSVYLALNIESDKFNNAVQGLKNLDILGINITVPYKVEIIKHLDNLSEEGSIIGAVNCIKITDGVWTGYNTDWYGVLKTLEINKISKSSRTLILGAGGASSGVIYGLKQFGITDITITNRTTAKAIDLADKYQINFITQENIISQKYELIINTTTAPFNELINAFDKNTVYFDLKYYGNKANSYGIIDGTEMLLYQGAMSFEIWTGKKAPLNIMREALYNAQKNS